MNEVEVKILEVNQVEIEKKLVELGAKKVFEGTIQATLFDYPDNRLDQVGSLVRLRQRGDEVEFAFKKRVADPLATGVGEMSICITELHIQEYRYFI